MIINFLQMREPPILPVLHQMDHEKSPDNVVIHGHDSSFFTNVDALQGFGRRNQESLGGLLFAFFRRFAYEFDYDTQVVSVRHGRYLSKVEKEWDQGQNSRLLCVEEPFNVYRNLGNSADEASVLGIKVEFQRAVHILLESHSLDLLCQPVLSSRQQSMTHQQHHLSAQHYTIQAQQQQQQQQHSSLANNNMPSYPYYMYYPTTSSPPPRALVGHDSHQYYYSPTRYQAHHSNVYTPFPSTLSRPKYNNSTTLAPSSYVHPSLYQKQANKGSGKKQRHPMNQLSNGTNTTNNGNYQQQRQYYPQHASNSRGIQRNVSQSSPPSHQSPHWLSTSPSIHARNGYNNNMSHRQQQDTKGRRWNGPKKPKGKRIQQHHPPTARQIFV